MQSVPHKHGILKKVVPITVAARTEAWNVFDLSDTRILWVRIPLEAWMSICLYSVHMLSCEGSGLETGWSHVQGVLPSVHKINKFRSSSELEQARGPNPSNHNKKEVVFEYGRSFTDVSLYIYFLYIHCISDTPLTISSIITWANVQRWLLITMKCYYFLS
jgi:hypothetical protein